MAEVSLVSKNVNVPEFTDTSLCMRIYQEKLITKVYS